MISGKSCLRFQRLDDCKQQKHTRSFPDGFLEIHCSDQISMSKIFKLSLFFFTNFIYFQNKM